MFDIKSTATVGEDNHSHSLVVETVARISTEQLHSHLSIIRDEFIIQRDQNGAALKDRHALLIGHVAQDMSTIEGCPIGTLASCHCTNWMSDTSGLICHFDAFVELDLQFGHIEPFSILVVNREGEKVAFAYDNDVSFREVLFKAHELVTVITLVWSPAAPKHQTEARHINGDHSTHHTRLETFLNDLLMEIQEGSQHGSSSSGLQLVRILLEHILTDQLLRVPSTLLTFQDKPVVVHAQWPWRAQVLILQPPLTQPISLVRSHLDKCSLSLLRHGG
mmetsp:Transcript_51624/g.129515  ORF Transcript_51624/g.129515 Transcript_51624/m.129515 type:complete len:277 (-) Transcript_51624:505-1335(-)